MACYSEINYSQKSLKSNSLLKYKICFLKIYLTYLIILVLPSQLFIKFRNGTNYAVNQMLTLYSEPTFSNYSTRICEGFNQMLSCSDKVISKYIPNISWFHPIYFGQGI